MLMVNKNWHIFSVEEIYSELQSGPDGLASALAASRLAQTALTSWLPAKGRHSGAYSWPIRGLDDLGADWCCHHLRPSRGVD